MEYESTNEQKRTRNTEDWTDLCNMFFFASSLSLSISSPVLDPSLAPLALSSSSQVHVPFVFKYILLSFVVLSLGVPFKKLDRFRLCAVVHQDFQRFVG